jgi:sugar-specific transcriptional regulator TrmB
MESNEVLTQIQAINPDAIKIMITGYPSIASTTNPSSTSRQNSYLIKPQEIDTLLKDLKEKLKDRYQQKMVLGKKAEDWVKLRINKIQLSEYSKFAEETADLFGTFGLSKTQAKVYMALNALGVATASEIAALSRIRREEVYRMMPELENRGIVSSRLEAPRKFAATEPKLALNILLKMKTEAIERETSKLHNIKGELASRLLNTSFGIYEESSVEALSRQDNVDLRLTQMSRKARNQILLVGSLDDVKRIIKECNEDGASQIRMRTIVEAEEVLDQAAELGDADFSRHFLLPAFRGDCRVELRQVDKRAFDLTIVDGREAVWGESKVGVERRFFWTNDSVQVGILRRAFENLWQEAVPCGSCLGEARASTLL